MTITTVAPDRGSVVEGPYVYARASVRVVPAVRAGDSLTVRVGVSEQGDVIYGLGGETRRRVAVFSAGQSLIRLEGVLIEDDQSVEPPGAVTFTVTDVKAVRVSDAQLRVAGIGEPSEVTVVVLDNDGGSTTTTTTPPTTTAPRTPPGTVPPDPEPALLRVTGLGAVTEGQPVRFRIETVPSQNKHLGVHFNIAGDAARFFGAADVSRFNSQRPHPLDANGMGVWSADATWVLAPPGGGGWHQNGSTVISFATVDDDMSEPDGTITLRLSHVMAGNRAEPQGGWDNSATYSATVRVLDNDCAAGQHPHPTTGCHDDHEPGCSNSGYRYYLHHADDDDDRHVREKRKPMCACPAGWHRHGTAACTRDHPVPACSPDSAIQYRGHQGGTHVFKTVQQCACANTATGEPQHRHTVGHRTDNVCHTHPRPACLAANPQEYWRIPVSGRRDDGRHDTFTLAACACASGEHRHGSSGACHDHTPPLCSLEGQSFHTHTSGAQDATDVRDGYVAACPGDLPKIKRVGTIRVGESANNAIIRVELNKPVRAGEIGIIRVETVNGTATPGADYKLIRGDDLRVNVGAGERSAVVRIPIVDDTEIEDDEHFTVILEAFGDLRSTRRIARVVIIDDDTPPDATVEAVSPRVVEGEQVSFVVQLSRTYKDTLRVRVRVRESGDMLTRKADERVHEVRIRPGSTAGYLTLRTQDDQTNEKASNITAVIQNPGARITMLNDQHRRGRPNLRDHTRSVARYQYNIGIPHRATARVLDNDRPPPVIGLLSDSAQITEGDTITLKASVCSLCS